MSVRLLSPTSLVLVVCALSGALNGCAHDEAPSESGGAQTSGTAGATTAPPATGTAGDAAGSTSTKPPTAAGGAGSTSTTTGIAGQTGQAGQTGAAGSGGVTSPQAGTGAAGSAGKGTEAGTGGGEAGKGSPSNASCAHWPMPMGSESVTSTIRVSGTMDGKLKRYAGAGALGGSGQDEGQDPLFLLADGATLENVILGAPAADGIHCDGTCTLRNVWWEDVGEDAATLLGGSDTQVMTIDCGGARKASDKVFQHNGPGTMRIQNFVVEDFGKLYRSCGNCKSQHERHVEMKGIEATKGKVLAGINTNYKDTAKFEDITLHDSAMKMEICDRFMGNNSGAEPSKLGSGSDGSSCVYMDSDIQWVP